MTINETLFNKIKLAADRWGKSPSPRLPTLTKFIENVFSKYNYYCHLGKVSYTPNKAPSGCRIRFDGKTIEGNLLEVFKKGNHISVLYHNSCEPYRYNWEVCQWIVDEMKKLGINNIGDI